MLFRLVLVFLAVQCFRRLDVGLSPRRPGFVPRSDHERFMLDKVTLRLVSQYLRWPVPPVFDILLYPHARTRRTNCPSLGTFQNISACSGIWDHWIEKYMRVVFLSSLHAGTHFEAFHLPYAGYQYFSGRSCDRPS